MIFEAIEREIQGGRVEIVKDANVVILDAGDGYMLDKVCICRS